MASKNDTYNPWIDKKVIGKLLEYESTPDAYEQLMWRQRYGKGSIGYRGCPHCKANPQVMGLGPKVPTHFPYTCKRCGGSISATFNTPMYGSKVPLPIWFDCIHLFMGGYDKGKPPLHIAAECTSDMLQRRYKLARSTASTLKFGVRDLTFPELKGTWGDELKGMYVSPDLEGSFERFPKAVQLCCQPLPPKQLLAKKTEQAARRDASRHHDLKKCHNIAMKEPATLYLLVGLPGAGKTAKARQLEVEAPALRFTPDEWMKTLFGRNDPATRDVLEGRLIWIALSALKLHTNVILDFGFWGKDERSSLRWMAKQVGAKSQVIYLPIDIEAQRERVQNRFVETPDQTWQMSEAELAKWRTLFDEPDEAELSGSFLSEHPHGYTSWSAWAAQRWPSLPDEYA